MPQTVEQVFLPIDVESQFLELISRSLLLVLDLQQLFHLLDLFVPQRFDVLLHLKGNGSSLDKFVKRKLHLSFDPDQLLKPFSIALMLNSLRINLRKIYYICVYFLFLGVDDRKKNAV